MSGDDSHDHQQSLVWYVAYGSNCYSERFRCYIEGGTPPGSQRRDNGARDPRPPHDERAVFIPHRLYFAGRSRRWKGGVAYIDSAIDDSAQTLGRAWLISNQQFIDVLRQENGDPDLDPNIDQAKQLGHHDVRDRGYGRLLYLGELDGIPMLTFTSPLAMAQRRPAAPSMDYLAIIATGLRECYGLNVVGLRSYLNACLGVKALSHGEAKKLLHQALAALGEDAEGQTDPSSN